MDCRGDSFDVCFLPRRPEDITGEACLQIITACWEAACRANDFVPPLCHAHDNHFTQVQLTEIWLGIRDYKDASLPFLDLCSGTTSANQALAVHFIALEGAAWISHRLRTQ